MFLILIRQILQMFLLAGVGFLLFRCGKITREGSRTIGNILIYISLPAVIINGFLVERTAEHVYGLLWSAAASFVLLLASVLVSHFVFGKDPELEPVALGAALLPVVVKLLIDDLLVVVPGDKLEGAAAYRSGFERVGAFLRNDGDFGQLGQKRCIGLLEMDDTGVIIQEFNGLDAAQAVCKIRTQRRVEMSLKKLRSSAME